MKANFQETIRQKTDKELEAISKDYVFYSEEERLIALNELDLRNGLSKELLLRKKEFETSIEMYPTMTEQALESVKSSKRIYTFNAIWVGSFLGGPLVAGYLIAENFKAFNEVRKAKKTWIYSIIGTIIIFTGVFLIPSDIKMPNLTIPFIYTAIAYFFVRHFQGRNISAYMSLRGEPFDWGRTIVVTLIGLVITVVLIFVFYFLLISQNFL
jgi:archaellum biogenesis protein FlaJ (TadC family)